MNARSICRPDRSVVPCTNTLSTVKTYENRQGGVFNDAMGIREQGLRQPASLPAPRARGCERLALEVSEDVSSSEEFRGFPPGARAVSALHHGWVPHAGWGAHHTYCTRGIAVSSCGAMSEATRIFATLPANQYICV